ncbi:protein E10 [Elephant endotheliotropic herpesvirus 5B]|nr:protein E10 [Elephant endotheliotropic herpesvirus 5B]
MSGKNFLHWISDKSLTTLLLTILVFMVITFLSRLKYIGKLKVTVVDLMLCLYGIYFSLYCGKSHCGGYASDTHCRAVNDVLNNILLILSVTTVGLICRMKFTEVPKNKRGPLIKYVRTLSRRWIPTLLALLTQLDWRHLETTGASLSKGANIYMVKEATLLVLWLLLFFVICDLLDKTGIVQVSGFRVYFYLTLFVFYVKNVNLTFYVRSNVLEYSRTCFTLPFVMYPLTRLFLLIQ